MDRQADRIMDWRTSTTTTDRGMDTDGTMDERYDCKNLGPAFLSAHLNLGSGYRNRVRHNRPGEVHRQNTE